MGKYTIKRKEEFVTIPGKEALPEFARPKQPPPLRLVLEAKSEWKNLGLATLCLLVSSLTSLSIPALFGRLIDSFDTGRATESSFKETVALLVAVSLIGSSFSFL